MNWEYELFWKKSVRFIERSHKHYKDSSLFFLWAAFSLEIIARGTLAFKHPALLADTVENDNILYAFEYSIDKEPKSIAIKTVFERISKIVDDFTKKDFDFCMDLMHKRNIEIHTGENVFENITTDKWQANYYRIIEKLLLFQNKKLEDLLPTNMLEIATEMIKKDYIKIEQQVKQLIRLYKDDFFKYNSEEKQKELREQAKTKVTEMKEVFFNSEIYSELRKCPACSSFAIVSGNIKTLSEPYIENEETITQLHILPTKLECKACGMTLNGYEKLQVANLASNIIVTEKYNLNNDTISTF